MGEKCALWSAWSRTNTPTTADPVWELQQRLWGGQDADEKRFHSTRTRIHFHQPKLNFLRLNSPFALFTQTRTISSVQKSVSFKSINKEKRVPAELCSINKKGLFFSPLKVWAVSPIRAGSKLLMKKQPNNNNKWVNFHLRRTKLKELKTALCSISKSN